MGESIILGTKIVAGMYIKDAELGWGKVILADQDIRAYLVKFYDDGIVLEMYVVDHHSIISECAYDPRTQPGV